MLPGYLVTYRGTSNRRTFDARLRGGRDSFAATLSWALGTKAAMVLRGSLALPLGDAGAEAAPLPARSRDHRATRRAGKRAAFPRRRAVQHAPVAGGCACLCRRYPAGLTPACREVDAGPAAAYLCRAYALCRRALVITAAARRAGKRDRARTDPTPSPEHRSEINICG